MIDFAQAERIVAFWWVDAGDKKPPFDWFGCLWRRRGAASWTVSYRFRWHVDDKVHDSADVKNAYTWSADGSEPHVTQLVASIADALAVKVGVPLETVWVRGDAARAAALLQLQPWAHFRVEEKPAKVGS